MKRYSLFILIMYSIIFANDMTLEGPNGTAIFIHRDEYGVPHIIADNDYFLKRT